MKLPAQHRPLVMVLAAAGALAVPGLQPAATLAAAETDTIHYSVPVSGTISVSCLGENVSFTGVVSGVEHTTVDAAGQGHSVGHAGQFHGTGVGLTSGRSFVLIGGTQDTTGSIASSDGVIRAAITTVFTTRYIGQGPANDYFSTVILHLTRNASGEVIVETETVIADGCR